MLIELTNKVRALFLLILCLSQSLKLYSQQVKVSKYERIWAIKHPIAAFKIKSQAKACDAIYFKMKSNKKLDGFENGGKVDAYRHVFYMAAFAQKVKARKLHLLGLAHEKTNYHQYLSAEKEFGGLSDSLSSVMDLLNNSIGIGIGVAHKKMNLEELSAFVIAEIIIGNAYILRLDRSGQFLDCTGELIDLKLYLHQWSVPKCLVKSNFKNE